MYPRVFAVMAVVLLVGADDKDAAIKDKETLQGTWVAVEGKASTCQITFSGDKFTLKFKDNDEYQGTFTLTTDKKLRTIDLNIHDIGERSKKHYKDKASLGIYKLEGDNLIWCANEPGKEVRPVKFAREDGEARYMYIVFKRNKP